MSEDGFLTSLRCHRQPLQMAVGMESLCPNLQRCWPRPTSKAILPQLRPSLRIWHSNFCNATGILRFPWAPMSSVHLVADLAAGSLPDCNHHHKHPQLDTSWQKGVPFVALCCFCSLHVWICVSANALSPIWCSVKSEPTSVSCRQHRRSVDDFPQWLLLSASLVLDQTPHWDKVVEASPLTFATPSELIFLWFCCPELVWSSCWTFPAFWDHKLLLTTQSWTPCCLAFWRVGGNSCGLRRIGQEQFRLRSSGARRRVWWPHTCCVQSTCPVPQFHRQPLSVSSASQLTRVGFVQITKTINSQASPLTWHSMFDPKPNLILLWHHVHVATRWPSIQWFKFVLLHMHVIHALNWFARFHNNVEECKLGLVCNNFKEDRTGCCVHMTPMQWVLCAFASMQLHPCCWVSSSRRLQIFFSRPEQRG